MNNRESVKRTFDEETVLKKFAFEKASFLNLYFQKKMDLKSAEYCTWREYTLKYSNYHQYNMTARKLSQSIDIKTLLSSISQTPSNTSINNMVRLSSILKDRTAGISTEWKKRREETSRLYDCYKVRDG